MRNMIRTALIIGTLATPMIASADAAKKDAPAAKTEPKMDAKKDAPAAKDAPKDAPKMDGKKDAAKKDVKAPATK